MDILKYNRDAWDGLVEQKNQWTIPVSAEDIDNARNGQWQIVLTPTRPVPRSWFGELRKSNVLCLAGGGGQQGPILAAAGADVTVLDNSPKQLEQDQLVAERHGLSLATIQGDMANLDGIDAEQFDLVVNPCSVGFVRDVAAVWREAFRVLKPGGYLLTGFTNPIFYLFDFWLMQQGQLEVRHRIPYSDAESLDENQRQRLLDAGEPFEYGHSLTELIGGQLAAGFVVTDFFEDNWPSGDAEILSTFIDVFIATRSQKPRKCGQNG